MYHELWKDAYDSMDESLGEVVLANAHRLIAKEGGEPEIILAAAMLVGVPKEKRQALLERHVQKDLHGEIHGLLEHDPANKNAAIFHDAVLLSRFNKRLWSGDIEELRALAPKFRTMAGKEDAKHYLGERMHDAQGIMRPGAAPLGAEVSPHYSGDKTSSASAISSMESKTKESESKEDGKFYHWADQAAQKIIASHGEKHLYTVAAGITPSGVIHIGNFREIITQDLVAKALEHQGKKVRFIYSWDDYDTFRKVPKNIPDQEAFKKYLFQPAVDVPDPFDCKHASYADHFKAEIQEDLPLVGIYPEFIHQHLKYRACEYAEDIREALLKREEIRAILNEFKTDDIADDWWPVLVYCEECNRDRTTKIVSFDGKYGLSYSCECGYSNTFDLRKKGIAKLPWRVDWPMRWRKEKVDFESAGKEHSSAGGSFDSGKALVEQIFGYPMVENFMYEFISIKGQKGKMSSSLGNTVTLRELLKVYTPELVRFLFAGTRPSATFDISFDVDIFKIYEDFDKTERIYFKKEDIANEKEYQNAKRIYELSILAPPKELPIQPSIRHLANYVQIAEGDLDRVVAMLRSEIKTPFDEGRVRKRAACAWEWVRSYAPEQYRFALQDTPYPVELEESVKAALHELAALLAAQDEQELMELFYQICEQHGIQNTDFFKYTYLVLIGKERGPKLASFITQSGHERIARVLRQV